MTVARLASAVGELGGELLEVRPQHGGIGGTSLRLRARFAEGERTVVARQPASWRDREGHDVAAREFQVLSQVHRAGVKAPEPLYLSPAEVAPRFYLLEFIEGEPDLRPSDPLHYAARLAETLAEVHAVPIAGLDLDPDLGPNPEWVPPQAGSDPERLRPTKIREALASLTSPQVEPCLVHGDPWPGNVIWDRGELVALIDWEEACAADPVLDLGIARLDLRWAFGVEAMRTFTEHYRAISGRDLATLPYWDLRALLRPVWNLGEWASVYPGFGRPELDEAHLASVHQDHFDEVLASLGQ